MHYHCEIVMPPTDDIEASVASIMKEFDENGKDEDGDRNRHSFWDFYVIGGRWAGRKLMAQHDKVKLEAFQQWLSDEGVTVSGFQAGKQTLQPDSQIPKVDAKWNEMFPSATFQKCPLFSHSNDQYGRNGDGTIAGDICALPDVPADLTCSRIIFAKRGYDYATKTETESPETEFMLNEDAWNGYNYMKVDWDGKFSSALAKYLKSIESYREEYAARLRPTDDWVVVTVDYHS